MHFFERYGLSFFTPQVTRLLLFGALGLLLLVLIPGFGVGVLGAHRWLSVTGPLQFQPSELAKLAVILHVARYLADNPRRLNRGFKQALGPVLVVLAPVCLLIMVEPDTGTMLVVALSVAALLVASGMPIRYVGILAAVGIARRGGDGDAVALPAGAAALLPAPVLQRPRRRLPGGPGPDRARLRGADRRRPRPLGAEDLLSPGGPDRLHPGRDRRGARRPGHLRGRVPVRDDRLRRAAGRAPRGRPVCEAPRDRV